MISYDFEHATISIFLFIFLLLPFRVCFLLPFFYSECILIPLRSC